MISAIICDTSAFLDGGADACAFIKDSASCGPREAERRAAYKLLSCLYSLLCPDSPMPEIRRREGGKPYFDSGELSFSISYRPGVALVAISDGGEIGADVELIVSDKEERMRALIARYAGKAETTELTSEGISLSVATMDAEGNIEIHNKNDNIRLHNRTKENENTPWVDWTVLEAVMKAHGSGLADYARIGELLTNTEAVSYTVSLGSILCAVTVASCVG